MSYAAAAALQAAVYGRLTGFAALAGVAVLDAAPPGIACLILNAAPGV